MDRGAAYAAAGGDNMIPVIIIGLAALYVIFTILVNVAGSGGGYHHTNGKDWDPLDPTDPYNNCPDCGSGDTDGNHCYDCDDDF